MHLDKSKIDLSNNNNNNNTIYNDNVSDDGELQMKYALFL